MHPNPAFRGESQTRNLEFARERGFGMLSINADPAPLLAHVPFVLDAEGTTAEVHLVRSNPIARAVTAPLPAVIAVTGPDAYVSPDWYGDPAQVPTWNYVAVHLRGTLSPLPQAAMRAHLDRVSAQFEGRLAPKRPWTADKMPPEVLERMMRAILPFRFEIAGIEGTWKLNQNKTDTARLAAAEKVAGAGIGQETARIAALMRGVAPS